MLKRLAYSFGLIVCILQAGCTVTTGAFEGVEPDYQDSFISQKVKVYIGDPQGGIHVKSTGAMEAASDFKGKTFWIYAFGTRQDASYQSKETAPDQTAAPLCLLERRAAKLEETGTAATWQGLSGDDAEPEYPRGVFSYVTYDFFANYLDDIQPSPERITKSQDFVECDIRINGTQDLMTSKAPGSYSYETARQDKHPIFTMEHQLVKFHFRIKPGVTPGACKWMRVESLRMDFIPNIRIKLAARNGDLTPVPSGAEERFPLISLATGEAVSAQDDIRVQTIEDASLFSEDMIRHIAGEQDCFLVPPAEKYPYELILSEALSGPGGQPLAFSDPVSNTGKFIERTDGQPFKAGSAYTITFTVFGKNEVAVFVTEMEAWDTSYSDSLEFSDLDD